jgi:hypothetical protein
VILYALGVVVIAVAVAVIVVFVIAAHKAGRRT